jgi:hypothetical protein
MTNGARFGRWGGLALSWVLAACSQSPDGTSGASGNTAPTISGSPATSVVQGANYQFVPSASDSDGDALIFGIDAKPAWAAFSSSTGQLSGTPGAADVGVFRGVVIWVSDGKAQTTLPAFDLTVSAQGGGQNRAPTISGTPPTSVVAGATYTFTPTASDADGDALTFTIRNKPSWATFSTTTGQLTGVPQTGNVGTFADVGISVSDGKAAVALQAFSIVVTPSTANRAPVISGAPMTTVAAGQAYVFVPTASDADGDALTFSIAGLPAWAAFNSANGQLSGTPPSSTTGTFANIVIRVSDGKASASLPAFAITVTAPTTNRPPTISGTPSTSVKPGAQYAFQPTATDPDGDPLTYTIANRPTWATFNTATGLLQGTPTAANIATYSNIVISVSDGKATVALPAFAITVSNTPPTISGNPPTTGTVGTAYTFTPTAADADPGTTLTFSITNKPSWASFSTGTGQLTGTPPTGSASTYASIVIGVSDGLASAQLPAFSIVVTQPNRPPTISGSPPTTASVATAYTFTPTANDPDAGTTLTFSITNKPSWASFSTSTGQLSGTPAAANVGTFSNIAISVSDGQASASLPAFSIVVTQSNSPPTISGSPPTTASVGTAYTFTPTANDPDAGTTLTFSITNKPSWASFSTSTGRLSGTPAAANVGTFSNIAIGVSDGQASASLPAFSIVVTQPNRAPTISGSPSTAVMQGTAYAFQPTASDADGDTLTFAIVNKPSWASFSTSTGLLQGTPGAGDVGTTSGIVISVSDGKAPSVALPAFSVTVQAVATGSATLTWTPPTTNTDGSALADLAGYKIYWGTTQGSYPNSVTLTNPGLTSYVVTNLVPGTYFFVATALNSAQVESAFSAPASKTIL